MTTETDKEDPPIIGLEVVGRGINLRPRQSYELKEVIFERYYDGNFQSIETGKTYSVPDGYAVNESPAAPGDQALGQIVIEKSWENFEAHFQVDSQVAAGQNAFSVDVQTGQINKLRSENASHYAVRTSFIPFWTFYIPDETGLFGKQKLKKALKLLPTPFHPKHRRKYEKFFERYGTHYIRRAWVGGKAMLIFTIAKSAQMEETEIRQGINASYALASGNLDEKLKQEKEKLQSSSECTVLGQGGEQSKLGALSSLDIESYNTWLGTIKNNPKVIEFEAVGIWTLIDDKEKADALSEAFKAATTFTPLSAIICFYDVREVYFLRGRKCTCYNIETGETDEPKLITNLWVSLSNIKGFESVDATLFLSEKNQLFFFKRNHYICLDSETNQLDVGPRPIAEGWPGVKFDRIDATLRTDRESVYFFMGDQYIRYNLPENRVDSGYPKLISEGWDGITFDRIDAAIAWEDGKAYFFKGNEYICYNMVEYRTEPGYPKVIASAYIEDWKLFGEVTTIIPKKPSFWSWLWFWR